MPYKVTKFSMPLHSTCNLCRSRNSCNIELSITKEEALWVLKGLNKINLNESAQDKIMPACSSWHYFDGSVITLQ